MRWRGVVLAEMRAISDLIRGELVPLLRASSVSAEELARQTLPGNRAIFRRGLRLLTVRMWNDTERLIVAGMQQMFMLADGQVEQMTFQAIAGRTDMYLHLNMLATEQAQVLLAARRHAARARNGHTLSTRVYLNQRGTIRRVQAEVDAAVRRGEGPDRLARRVKRFINPDVPGGASYAALRLARTELLGAWDARERQLLAASGIYSGAEWMLSPTHKRDDICDELAEGGPYTLGELPDRPHPHCMCWLEPVIDEEVAARAEARAG